MVSNLNNSFFNIISYSLDVGPQYILNILQFDRNVPLFVRCRGDKSPRVYLVNSVLACAQCVQPLHQLGLHCQVHHFTCNHNSNLQTNQVLYSPVACPQDCSKQLTFYSLADLFIQELSQFLWETFSHATVGLPTLKKTISPVTPIALPYWFTCRPQASPHRHSSDMSCLCHYDIDTRNEQLINRPLRLSISHTEQETLAQYLNWGSLYSQGHVLATVSLCSTKLACLCMTSTCSLPHN